jgi:uncharacterized protein (TIGR02421 family)
VDVQRPLRILDALRWEDHVEDAFFAAGGRELPAVDSDYYGLRHLPFYPAAKRAELRDLERQVCNQLGSSDPAGGLLTRRCREYLQVVDLLEQRGTPAFGELSAQMYGRSCDPCLPGGAPLLEMARRLGSLFDGWPGAAHESNEPTLAAGEVVKTLSERLGRFFQNQRLVRVRLSTDLSADAAAGGDCIKVRWDAQFRARDVRMLEVHEGWVHLGTTLNGQSQPICTFLSKPVPSATVTQEGLAVLTEVLALASDPVRVRRLAQRVEAVALAEAGADFLDVYRFFLQQGYSPSDSYQHTARIFRGSLPAGCGPFTKDLCYARGFILLLDHLRRLMAQGQTRRFSLLFCGKTSLEDLDSLAELVEQGLVSPPRYLPPPFVELMERNATTSAGWGQGNAAGDHLPIIC